MAESEGIKAKIKHGVMKSKKCPVKELLIYTIKISREWSIQLTAIYETLYQNFIYTIKK